MPRSSVDADAPLDVVETAPVLDPGEPWPEPAPRVTPAEAVVLGAFAGAHLALLVILILA